MLKQLPATSEYATLLSSASREQSRSRNSSLAGSYAFTSRSSNYLGLDCESDASHALSRRSLMSSRATTKESLYDDQCSVVSTDFVTENPDDDEARALARRTRQAVLRRHSSKRSIRSADSKRSPRSAAEAAA